MRRSWLHSLPAPSLSSARPASLEAARPASLEAARPAPSLSSTRPAPLPATEPSSLHSTSLASLHSTRPASLHASRQWNFRWQIPSMAVIVVVAFMGLTIVPALAELDFVRDHKPAEKQNVRVINPNREGVHDVAQHKLVSENREVVRPELNNDQNAADNTHQHDNAAAQRPGQGPAMAQLLKKNLNRQKLLERHQKFIEKQKEEDKKQLNQFNEFVSAVEVAHEKKLEEAAAKANLNQAGNASSYNTQQNDTAHKNVYNDNQKVREGGGPDLLAGAKDDRQREDAHLHGVKSALEDNKDDLAKREARRSVRKYDGAPVEVGNGTNPKSQTVNSNLGGNNFNPPALHTSGDVRQNKDRGDNEQKSQEQKEVDSAQQQPRAGNLVIDAKQQGQVNGENNPAQQQDVFNNNNNILQQQQQVQPVGTIDNFNQQQQQQPQEQQQQQQPQQPTGGIDIRWDWEDFSIMLNSYGAAEMKVRRAPHATAGEPWPMPQYYSKKNDKVFRLSKDFSFVPVGVTCDVLDEALSRHLQRTLRGSVEDMYDNLQHADGTPIEDPALRYAKPEFVSAPVISRVEVKVKNPCSKYPSLESDESYDLVVKKKKVFIWANEVWGAVRGLETFGHLVWKGTDDFLYIKETVISDYPRFPHRGMLIDTSRHYLFKEVILDVLDSMEMNKLNVFHWHIVDDQSFPYESKAYPELSRKGAFHPTYVYSLEDIAEIIEYARLRGIRVMPEFDTPGHTYAWGFSRPELLTQCYTGNMPVKGYFGPIDPSKNATYRFLQTLFQEIVEVFKDQYLHLGGDEVPLGCWQSNPEVLAFARELAKIPRTQQAAQFPNNGGFSMWSDEIRGVYEYYENRLISIVSEAGQKKKKAVKYVMWQEVMNNNLQLPNDTIIQVWMGDMGDVHRATSMGYQVLYSTCWYMDHIEYGTKWPKYYNCDPVDQSFGYRIDEKKVLGGEAAFWSEYFTNENLLPLMWPRASAAAERLWSSKDVKNLDKAAARLTEHRCRMIKRGINVGEINGPGYCLHAPPRRYLFNETLGCKGGNCTHTRSLIKENFEVFVSQRGGLLSECGRVLTSVDGNIFIIVILIFVGVIALYAVSKSSNRLQRIRICKNRTILIVFVLVVLVYFLCYTTIWMHAFDFSGSYHKTQQEDNTSDSEGIQVDKSENTKTASS